MNHRKISHPSNKRCRNFPASCEFGNKCWYVHAEIMDTTEKDIDIEKKDQEFKCNICKKVFREKQYLMQHRKTEHIETVQRCKMFDDGQCQRSNDECWFVHLHDENVKSFQQKEVPKKQVFQEASENALPPDQMSKLFWMVTNLCNKVQNIEKKFEDLMI